MIHHIKNVEADKASRDAVFLLTHEFLALEATAMIRGVAEFFQYRRVGCQLGAN